MSLLFPDETIWDQDTFSHQEWILCHNKVYTIVDDKHSKRLLIMLSLRERGHIRAVFFELNVVRGWENTLVKTLPSLQKKNPLGPLDSHTCLPNLVLFFLMHLSQVFEGSCSTRIFIPNIEFSSWKGPFWKDNEARARTTQPKWEGKIGFSQSANSFLRSRVPVGQKGIPGWSAVSLCSSETTQHEPLNLLGGEIPSSSLACTSPWESQLTPWAASPQTGITVLYSFCCPGSQGQAGGICAAVANLQLSCRCWLKPSLLQIASFRACVTTQLLFSTAPR